MFPYILVDIFGIKLMSFCSFVQKFVEKKQNPPGPFNLFSKNKGISSVASLS